MKRLGVLAGILCGMVILGLLMTGPAAADKTVIINNYGMTPFIYGGCSYIPLRSATDFLGAALLWDSLKGRAVITYNGKEMGLTVGSPVAYYAGAPVNLPAPPVIIDGRVFIPTMVVRDHLGVVVEWDAKERKVRIYSGGAWGVMVVPKHTPPHILRIMRGYGPPPWAGGPGRRAAPPPGLSGKPGGMPPGQAKKAAAADDDKGGKDKGKGHQHGHQGD
jgi:hypothetical protein